MHSRRGDPAFAAERLPVSSGFSSATIGFGSRLNKRKGRPGQVSRTRFLHVAALVFLSTVIAEGIAFEVLYPGSTLDLLHRRGWLLLFMITVTLLNAAVAAYFSHLAAREELLRRQREEQVQQTADFLNHHVRNALTGVQYAAHLTNDPAVIRICDEAVARITNALVAAGRDLTGVLPMPNMPPVHQASRQETLRN
jgi:hypothetical protein